MSCYHPLVGFPSGQVNHETGKQKLIIRKEYLKYHKYEDVEKNNGILIPCGHCIGCRLDYSRKWADRMMLELETEKKGIFITLTYDNEHLPVSEYEEVILDGCYSEEELKKEGIKCVDGVYLAPKYGTLVKRDWQLFMKSLRREFDKKNIKLRFYASGEYGEKYKRPHYHGIIFGIGLDDIDDGKLFKRNALGQAYYVSDKLTEIWSRGFVSYSDVSFETCAYVARYVTKKLNGDMSIWYSERNCIPEFSLMSRMPGIGSKFLELNPDCLDFQTINISTPEGGRKIMIPEYYLRKLELTDKKRYDRIREERRKFASDKMLIELSKTDLGLAEYLEVKEENRKNLIKVLKRKDVDVKMKE